MDKSDRSKRRLHGCVRFSVKRILLVQRNVCMQMHMSHTYNMHMHMYMYMWFALRERFHGTRETGIRVKRSTATWRITIPLRNISRHQLSTPCHHSIIYFCSRSS